MCTLNQEVSELSKNLHHMMHLLQAHVTMHHYNSSISSYPYGVHVVSNPPSAPNTSMSFNVASSFLQHDPASHEGHHSGRYWSHSGGAGSQAEGHCQPQSSSPAAAHLCSSCSVNSAPRLDLPHGSGSKTPHPWTATSLLGISPDFQGGTPGPVSSSGQEDSDSRPLSESSTVISQSQPTLCLEPPSGAGGEYSCLFRNVPTSTHSLLASTASSYPQLYLPSEPHPHPAQTKQGDLCSLASDPEAHNLVQDASVFRGEESHLSFHPLSPSPPAFSSQQSVSSQDSGPSRPDALDPKIPLGNSSAVEHTSLECLLGNGGSTESRDSGSVSSRQSSIGVQTQSTDQSWCLDLTD